MIRRIRVSASPQWETEVWTGLGLPKLTRLTSGFAGVRTQLLPSNHLDRALGGKSGDPQVTTRHQGWRPLTGLLAKLPQPLPATAGVF